MWWVVNHTSIFCILNIMKIFSISIMKIFSIFVMKDRGLWNRIR